MKLIDCGSEGRLKAFRVLMCPAQARFASLRARPLCRLFDPSLMSENLPDRGATGGVAAPRNLWKHFRKQG